MKEHVVKDFLSIRLDKGAKLLLGLSGGPDSMALLYFLLECLPQLDFSLHLAHVDHGWREESGEEVRTLQKLAAQLKLPFHLHTLKEMTGPDLENRCRDERLAFFKRLHREHHFQALLLAHHSGDQAETVLKRVFEGAGLRALGGLQAIKVFGDLPVWRPLLSYNKSELISFLERKHILPPLSSLMKKNTQKLGFEHLPLKNILTTFSKSEPQSKTYKRALFELCRRLFFSCITFTFTYVGISLGMQIGRGRRKKGIYVAVLLAAFTFICSIAAKSYHLSPYKMIFFYAVPIPILFFVSYSFQKRLLGGVE